MSVLKVRTRGGYDNLERFLAKSSKSMNISRFAKYGEEGLEALKRATPVDTGLTAASWSYHLEVTASGVKLSWNNSNIVNHIPIAVILDNGHADRSGAWVEGRHYIAPALQPVFDKIANEMWKELTT